MKKKKWLLVIVGILFLINIAFYGIVRWGKVDLIVKNRVEQYLETQLSAEINIDYFTFNDKQLNINDLKLDSQTGEYDLNIRQIYIEYDLPMLIFSNFTNYKAIEEIKVFEPELQVNLRSQEEEADTESQIPDIARFFKHLTIYNGKVRIAYQNETVNALALIDTLDLSLKNTSQSEIEYDIRNKNGSYANGSLILKEGELTKLDLQLRDFSPAQLSIKQVDSIDLAIDADLNYQPKILTVSGEIKDLEIETFERDIEIASIPFTLKDDDLSLSLKGAYLDGNQLNGEGAIVDVTKPQKQLKANLSSVGVQVNQYLQSVTGEVDLDIVLSGTNYQPRVAIKVNSDLLTLYGQQVEDLLLQGEYQNDTLDFRLEKLQYFGNPLQGSGTYSTASGLNCQLTGSDFYWNYNDLQLSGDVTARVELKEELQAFVDVRQLAALKGKYQLEELSLTGQLHNSDLQLSLQRDREDLNLDITGDLQKRTFQALLHFSRFDPAQVFNNFNLPLLSGSFNLDVGTSQIRTFSSLRVFDRNYASLNGRLIFDSFLDLPSEKLRVSLRTSQARYNFEPFSLNLFAEGDMDSLYFKRFDINKEIFIKGYAALGENRNIDLDLSFDKLNIKKYLKYFTNYNFYSLVDGKASLDLNYRSTSQDTISGNLNIDNFSYDNSQDINILTDLEGSTSDLALLSTLYLNQQVLFTVNSGISLLPQFSYELSSKIRDLNLADIFTQTKAAGKINADINFCHECGDRTLDIMADVEDIELPWIAADSLHIDLNQSKDLLKINDISASRRKKYNLSASGSIGYDLLFMNIYPDTNTVKLKFEGDLFQMLSTNAGFISEADSDCEIELELGLKENGLSINRGKLLLRKGSARIAQQLERLENLQIDLEILNNEMQINEFSGNLGTGKFFLENSINNQEDEFVLGNLQIGKIYLYTDRAGINMHLPNYMPGNSVANAVIKGRNSDKLEISGPFDNIFFRGDVHFYNGAAIFPSDTENLVKFVAKIAEERSSWDYDIPLNLDLVLHFQENIRYVTYPLNLLVQPGSYMNLKFNGEKFTVDDASFISESGFIDIFGTQMAADYVQVKISPYEQKLNVNGLFYKQASDGTLLTLLVTSREDPAAAKFFALDFDLRSDDPNDSQTDILALLRYGRRQDEISPDQRSAILQDEVIQLAGLGLENAVIDPFISPVESWIRKILRLDFFHLQTDLIQNIFDRYSSDRTDYVVDEEGRKLSQTTSDLFLNNLSIGMGKYVSRRVFLDYELEFQKPQDISIESDMGIYHNISIRYDLPYNLKLAYKFHILPFDEKNTHEISLERSFRF